MNNIIVIPVTFDEYFKKLLAEITSEDNENEK